MHQIPHTMKRYLFFVFPVILFACGNNTEQRTDGFSQKPQTKEDSLYEDVMKGHDVGMAKMAKIKSYLQESTHVLDSVAKLPGSKKKSVYQQKVLTVQSSLKNADSLMDKWMENFSPDSFATDKPKRIEYLQSEKNKVNTVRDMILQSLNKADSLFKR